jgi:predicted phage terminase large subunit-like protein
MKSISAAVLLTPYAWIRNPSHQFLYSSYAKDLAVRDSVKSRRLIQSPWFQELWGDVFQLAGDQNAKTRFENTHNGHRLCCSTGSATTGEGGDTLVMDDPHNAMEAQSDVMRKSDLEWYDQGFSTRHNNPKTGATVCVMQRLHENDMTGHLLEMGGWEHLCLPAEYDGRRIVTSIGWVDPRKEQGELLWPERFDTKELARLKKPLGDYGVAGQLQQRPDPATGGIINAAKIRLWPAKSPLPDFSAVIQSYDTALDENEMNDYTACVVLGLFEHKGRIRVMLVDAWHERLGYDKLRPRVKKDIEDNAYGEEEMAKRADYALIERKGSGISLIQDLAGRARNRIRGYNPGSLDKVARARLVAPLIDDELVFVCESTKNPGQWANWAAWLHKELRQFPVGEHDDGVDALVQGLRHLHVEGFITISDDIEEPDEFAEERAPRVNPYAA